MASVAVQSLDENAFYPCSVKKAFYVLKTYEIRVKCNTCLLNNYSTRSIDAIPPNTSSQI